MPGPKKRVFNAGAHQGRRGSTGDLPFRMVNGFRSRPADVREAVRFITKKGRAQIREHCEEQQGRVELWPHILAPDVVDIRKLDSRSKRRTPQATHHAFGRAP